MNNGLRGLNGLICCLDVRPVAVGVGQQQAPKEQGLFVEESRKVSKN